jgi:hypothetical protein
MKRSGQVALVLMGVTGATAAGAYMLPARPACPAPQPAPVRDIMDLGKPAVPQGVAVPGAQPAVPQQPCRSSGSSNYHGGWHWYSHSNSYSSYSSNGRAPTSTSVGFASSNSSLHSGSGSSSSSSSSSSSTARGGFGSSGHAASGGGHAGS